MDNNNSDVKWHQSISAIVVVLVGAAILTSPCWGLALLLAVVK